MIEAIALTEPDAPPSRSPRLGGVSRLLARSVAIGTGRRAQRLAFRTVVGAFVAVILLSYGLPLWYHAKGEQLLVVTSGSMRPTVHEGDAVVVHSVSPTELRRNMVITFWTAAQAPRVLETHRIVDLKTLPVTDEHGKVLYDAAGQVELRQVIQTKGDNNQYPDPNMTPVTNVRGVVVAVKHGWGRQLLWAHSPRGRLLIFGPPLVLLLGAEIRSWFRRAQPPVVRNGPRDATALTV